MKVFVRTDKEEQVDTVTGIRVTVPYLPTYRVLYSVMDCDKYFVCRISGTLDEIRKVTDDTRITILNDDDVRDIIKSRYPDSDLESLDVADPEIDEIAKRLGIDPQLRADIQVPSRGRQVLQDQEVYLLARICEKIDLTKSFWDNVAPLRWKRGIDIEYDIKDGKGEAEEFVLSRIRKLLQ